MKPSELLFLAVLAVYAGASLWGGLGMPYSSAQTFGPGFLPVNMAAAVLVLAALIVLRGTLLRRRAAAGGGAEAPGWRGAGVVGLTLALVAAAVFASRFGSLLLPLGLALVLVTAVAIGRSWRTAVLSTLVLMVAVYVVFDVWLQIPVR